MEKWEIKFEIGFIGLFILSVLLASQLHELGHYAAAKFQGADIVMFFDRWQLLSAQNQLPVLLAGNIANIFLAYLGLGLLLKSERFKDLGFSLAFSNAVFRIGTSVGGLAGAMIGDESHIARIMNVGPEAVYAFFLLIFLPPLFFAFQAFGKEIKQKFLRFLMLLGLLGGTMAFVVLMGKLAHSWQDFFLFSLIDGLPLAMILLNVLILGLLVFFLIRRLKVKART